MFLHRFALGVVCLALGTAWTSQAQSFDCRGARTGIEKAICANPDLTALDNELARLFRIALKGPGAQRHGEPLLGQRIWLFGRNVACREAGVDEAKARFCVETTMRERIAELQKVPAAR